MCRAVLFHFLGAAFREEVVEKAMKARFSVDCDELAGDVDIDGHLHVVDTDDFNDEDLREQNKVAKEQAMWRKRIID